MEEIARFNQTQSAHEAEASTSKLRKMTVERFQWVVETPDAQEVKRSSMIFLSMRNCLDDACLISLQPSEKLNYKTVDLEVSDMVVIRKVFLYFLRGDYKDICNKKCLRCKSLNLEEEHAVFCLENVEPILDYELVSKALIKMSAKRILKGTLSMSSFYNIPLTAFTMSKCKTFLNDFSKYDFEGILENIFEYEMNGLDD